MQVFTVVAVKMCTSHLILLTGMCILINCGVIWNLILLTGMCILINCSVIWKLYFTGLIACWNTYQLTIATGIFNSFFCTG